jgi:putative ABC transport system permease protein
VLVKLRGGGATGFMIDRLYNRQGDRLTFAWPIGQIVAHLLSRITWFDRVLTLVAFGWLLLRERSRAGRRTRVA